jgi:type II secretion system protein N
MAFDWRERVHQLQARLPHLGPRARKVVRYVGYGFLALFTFVFALQCTFPYERVKDRLEDALEQKYDVTIQSVERGWVPGRMYLKSVTLRTRPSASDVQKVMEIADAKERDKQLALLSSTFFLESIQVDVGLLAAIGGKASIDIDAQIESGHIAGNITIGKSGTDISLAGEDLPSARLPMREIIGLPMNGVLEFDVDLDLPNEKLKTGKVGANWQKAEGEIELACPRGCTFGDGKTKLKAKLKNPRNQAFAEGGIEFGKVNIDKLIAHVDVKDGHLKVTKFDSASQDGELHVDFDLTLAQEFNESMTAGCLRFNGSDSLLKRDPKTHAAISTTGANLGPDNLFHIRLDGKFKEMKRLPQFCGPGFAGKNMDNMAGSGGSSGSGAPRPSVTVQPEGDVRPGSNVGDAIAPPPPPATPPPNMQPPVDAGVASPPHDAPFVPGVNEGAPPAGSGSAPGSAGSATGGEPAGSGTGAPPPPGTNR